MNVWTSLVFPYVWEINLLFPRDEDITLFYFWEYVYTASGLLQTKTNPDVSCNTVILWGYNVI